MSSKSPAYTTTSSPTPYPQKRDDIDAQSQLEILEDEGSVEDKPMDERIEDRRQELLLCSVTEDIQSNLAETNLCNYTLTAMGDMCGMSAKNKNKNNGPRTIPDSAYKTGADEYTSIEVEYVQPRLKKPISKKAAQQTHNLNSTTKRGLLLQGLNEKARQEYKKEVRTSPQEFPDDDYAQSTIYNSFSHPEKRKFVKLISLNVSPTDAANQVLRERREGVMAAQEQAKGQKNKKGIRKFFGKKSKQPAHAEEEEPEMKKPDFSNSGINYYDAIRKVDAEGYVEQEEENPAADSKKKKKKKKKSLLPSFKKKRFDKLSGVEPKAPAQSPSNKNVNSPTNAVANNDSSSNNRALAAGAVVAGAAAVGAAAAMASKDSHAENPEDEDWMPPSPSGDEAPTANLRGVSVGAATNPMTEEVLRDLAMADQGGGVREERKIEDDMAAQLLAPMSSQKKATVEMEADEEELDDFDTYLKSTEANYGGVSLATGNVPDHATVASYKTSGTNATTSTRSRRPGQAQKRMQQQRVGQVQSRNSRTGQARGWQETMQQAAAENNRTWDPQRGWVDYGDPNAPQHHLEPTAPEPGTNHRGHGATMTANRDARMEAPVGQDQQGWAETMKAASARLLQAGKRWDPELGWVGTGSPNGKAVPRQDDGNVNTQSPSDTADFGTGGLLDGEGQDEKLMIYEDENSETGSQNKAKVSLLVDVKKEKVDSEDVEYFSPRSTGPVDSDAFVEEPGTIKFIPKLKGPKRDTSPVSRGRRSLNGGTTGLSSGENARAADGEESNKKSSEWKTFLAKKQAAESEANRQGVKDNGSEVASEASTSVMQGPDTFLGRLQACAAPILPANRGLSQNSAAMRYAPAVLCGRPGAIHEGNDDDTTIGTETTPEAVRSRSRSRSRPHSGKSDVSSVISDEMSGSKAAFLESMAMKAVVSSKSKRRSTGSEAGGSTVSYGQRSSLGASPTSAAGASSSSNKWQQFLDKKKAENGDGSVVGARSQASSSVSRAAEMYAAKKMQEMMETQNSSPSGGSSFKPRPMEESSGAFPKPARIVTAPSTPKSDRANMLPFEASKSSSAIAAEEAKAARLRQTVSTPTRSRERLPFEPQKSESQKAAEEAKAMRLSALRASLSGPQE